MKNIDRVINMLANSKHYNSNRFNKILYQKELGESSGSHSHCIADDKQQHGIIVKITAYCYLVYYHINSLSPVLERFPEKVRELVPFVNVLRH